MFNKKRSELPTRLYNKNLWEFGKKKLIRNSKGNISFFLESYIIFFSL